VFLFKKYSKYINVKFGRLYILKILPNYKRSLTYARCKCDCGKIKNISIYSLLYGTSKSCGCLNIRLLKERSYIHGDCNTNFYKSWTHLKERCDNPNNKRYRDYGGRGITYDSKWKKYLGFKKDMYLKYLLAKRKYKVNRFLSIERLDVNGDYCFDNCCFIPRKEQAKNTRKNKWFLATNLKTGETIKGSNQSIFAKENNLNSKSISKVLNGQRGKTGGWTFVYID
jgi:hypothetical protein